MTTIRCKQLTKIFPNGHIALDKLSMTVTEGEYLVLVGPSGCGKTTTLRLLAGLEQATEGRIYFDEREITSSPPHKRHVAMVFQSHLLYPHLSVRGNLGFPLSLRNQPKREIHDRVQDIAERLGLVDLLDRQPDQLSGGQQQRVALGRALIQRSQVVLLDEPLSNLDASLRLQLQSELRQLHRDSGQTFLHVTHDQEEAMSLGDRIAVLDTGKLRQLGTPQELYRQPANMVTAEAIGSPPMNLVACTVHREADRVWLQSATFRLDCPEMTANSFPDDEVVFGIRPEAVELVSETVADGKATVQWCQSVGNRTRMQLQIETVNQRPFAVITAAETVVHSGQVVFLRLPTSERHFFDLRSGERRSGCLRQSTNSTNSGVPGSPDR